MPNHQGEARGADSWVRLPPQPFPTALHKRTPSNVKAMAIAQAWSRWGPSLGLDKAYGELIELQAHRLKAALLGRKEYTPFYLWR